MRNIWTSAAIFFAITIALIIVGSAANIELLSFIGTMLMAGTFLPVPADTYMLYLSPYHAAWVLGIVGGFLNGIAVLLEMAWVQQVIKKEKFRRVTKFFGESRFTKYMRKHMFIMLLIGGYSILPFEPFRLVAIVTDYDKQRYFLATFIGRGARYFTLAFIGKLLFSIQWLNTAIIISLVGFFIGAYEVWKRKERALPSTE